MEICIYKREAEDCRHTAGIAPSIRIYCVEGGICIGSIVAL